MLLGTPFAGVGPFLTKDLSLTWQLLGPRSPKARRCDHAQNHGARKHGGAYLSPRACAAGGRVVMVAPLPVSPPSPYPRGLALSRILFKIESLAAPSEVVLIIACYYDDSPSAFISTTISPARPASMMRRASRRTASASLRCIRAQGARYSDASFAPSLALGACVCLSWLPSLALLVHFVNPYAVLTALPA